MKIRYTTVLLLLISSIGFANNDLQAIRDEINAMKQQYENKIAALEERLKSAEAAIQKQSQALDVTNEKVNAQDSVASDSAQTTNPNTFNPALSLIFDTKMATTSASFKRTQNNCPP